MSDNPDNPSSNPSSSPPSNQQERVSSQGLSGREFLGSSDDDRDERAAEAIRDMMASNGKQEDAPASNALGPLAETVTHERRWDNMFDRLREYKLAHGNCLVPNRYATDTQLGSWVSAQRRQYKIVTSGGNESAAMTPERAKKLRELGFEWSTTNPRNVPWETRYNELRDFVDNYGHAEVPMRWEENPQLSNWVSKQRHQFKLMQSNRPSRLNKDKVQSLDEIGFVWEASRRRLLDEGMAGSAGDDSDPESSPKRAVKKIRRLNQKVPRRKPIDPRLFLPDAEEQAAAAAAAGRPFGGAVEANSMRIPNPAAAAMSFAQAAQAQAVMVGAVPGAVVPPAVLQANFGLWAAMAAGQANFMQNPAMAAAAAANPAMAAAAAAGAAMNPQLLMQMGAMMPFAAGVMPGMPFHPGQMAAASMMPGGMAVAPSSGSRQPDPPEEGGFTRDKGKDDDEERRHKEDPDGTELN